MKFEPRRTVRYYYLRFLRLKADPGSIARGVSLGVFIGITPTLPLHTVLLLALVPLLRGNLVAAFLAATVVSNPLTFPLQYSLSWIVGSYLLPCDVSWNDICTTLDMAMGEAPFLDALKEMAHLGRGPLITLVGGGTVLALPPAVASYFGSRWLVVRYRMKKREMQRLT
ncbi:MAG: DUF2062 domain-containing protein [Thermodesulfobacteriota bacterium]